MDQPNEIAQLRERAEKAERERGEWKTRAFEHEAKLATECESCECGQTHRERDELREQVASMRDERDVFLGQIYAMRGDVTVLRETLNQLLFCVLDCSTCERAGSKDSKSDCPQRVIRRALADGAGVQEAAVIAAAIDLVGVWERRKNPRHRAERLCHSLEKAIRCTTGGREHDAQEVGEGE